MTYKALLFQAPEFIDEVLISHYPLCSAGFPPPSGQPVNHYVSLHFSWLGIQVKV